MDLMELLPPVYEENETMKEAQALISAQINKLASDLNTTIDQCFIDTATHLLSRYERIYGLTVDTSKSNQFRRERIKAKAKGVGTITKKMLEDVAASYSNGEVEVIENPENYSFIVKFVGTRGIPANMADLTLTIEEIKPAHLAFTFEYTFLTWGEFDEYNKIWAEWDALNLTWDELEVYKE